MAEGKTYRAAGRHQNDLSLAQDPVASQKQEQMCTVVPGHSCPAPSAEDRMQESLHFLHKLEEAHHDPMQFRFSLNAFLAATKSVRDLLQRDMEKRGHVEWWNARRVPFVEDPVLARIARSRDLTLHQKAIFNGSRLAVGLFRGRRIKLGLIKDVRPDVDSRAILALFQNSAMASLFLDEEHSAIGEQYGVLRQYFIEALSGEDDALTVCRRAFARTYGMVGAAHEIDGVKFPEIDEEALVSPESLSKVTVLLETDVDPSLIDKWDWR